MEGGLQHTPEVQRLELDHAWGRCRFSHQEVQDFWKVCTYVRIFYTQQRAERPKGRRRSATASQVEELEDSTVSSLKKREIKSKGLAPFSGKRGVSRKKTTKQTQNQLQSSSPLYPITESSTGNFFALTYSQRRPKENNFGRYRRLATIDGFVSRSNRLRHFRWLLT